MGYDVELIDPAAKKDASVCPHCKNILEVAMQTDEGVRLCKGCLEEIRAKPGGHCSCCGITITEGQYYADKAAQREVNAIQVVCKHKRFGCPWQGKLQDYKSHVADCAFAGVQCPNPGCGETVLSSELESHLLKCQFRLVTCNHCQEKLVAKDLEAHHSTSCRMIPVECERCGEKVPHRHQLQGHLLDRCKLEECIVCSTIVDRKTSRNVGPVLSISASLEDPAAAAKSPPTPSGQGGKKAGARSRQKQSRKAEQRLPAATEEGAESEEEGGAHLGQPVTVFRHMQRLASQQGELRSDLTNLSQTTETKLADVGSHGNAGVDEGVREMVGRLERQLTEFKGQVDTEQRRREEVQQRLDRALDELQKVQQLAQDARDDADTNRRELEGGRVGGRRSGGPGGVTGGKVGGRWEGGGHLESRVLILEQRTEQQERENNTLKVNLSELELQLQASLASTHNGSFLWRIPEVARRRRDAIDERITSIYSPPFYSGRNGYKMCIRAYLNGDGSGYKTHFSVFFVLMRGEFDPLLKWPFEYKVSLILVDQDQRRHIVQTFKPTAESSSFKRPSSDMNVASGCPQFSKLSVLDNDSYVKEDVLYLKCIIDTSRIFHP